MPAQRKERCIPKRLRKYPIAFFHNDIGRVRGGLEVPPPPVAIEGNQAPDRGARSSHDEGTHLLDYVSGTSPTPRSDYSGTYATTSQQPAPQPQIPTNHHAPTLPPQHYSYDYGYLPPTSDNMQNYYPQQQGTNPFVQPYYQGNDMVVMGGSPNGVNTSTPYSEDMYSTMEAFFYPSSASGLSIAPGAGHTAPPNTDHYPLDPSFGNFGPADPRLLGFRNPEIPRSSAYFPGDDSMVEVEEWEWDSEWECEEIAQSTNHDASAELENIQV